MLGILVAEFEPFSTELLKGASAAVASTGYELLAYSGGGRGADVGWERRYLSRLSGTLIDGAVIVTPTVVATNHGVPVVAVDPHTGPSALPTVDSDNFGGAVLATNYLLALGPPPDRVPRRAHRPRVGPAARGGLPPRDGRRRRHGGRLARARRRVQGRDRRCSPPASCSRQENRPTAVFAANDLSAIGTIEVARSLGLRVPDDLSVIGFDNVPESALTSPPLTTINQPLQRMGAEALRLLVDLIDGVERDVHVRLPTELLERSSCRGAVSPATGLVSSTR